MGGRFVLFDALLEPGRLRGGDIPQLDHELLEHDRSDLRAFLKLLEAMAKFVVRTEPQIDRHFAERCIIAGFAGHSFSPWLPRGRIHTSLSSRAIGFGGHIR